MIRPLKTQDIEDRRVRESLIDLNSDLRNHPFANGDFKLFTLKFTTTGANLKQRHGFNFVPKDIILTSAIGSGTVAFNYDKFDRDSLDFTIGGTVTEQNPFEIRFLAGRFN